MTLKPPSYPSGGGVAFTPAIGVTSIDTGNLTTTSTSFVDLAGVTTTITTGAHRVLLGFVGFGSANGASNELVLTFAIDGTAVGGDDGLIAAGGGAGVDRNLCFTFTTDVLAAGSHTFKVQWFVTSGTGTVFASTTAPATIYAIEQGA